MCKTYAFCHCIEINRNYILDNISSIHCMANIFSFKNRRGRGLIHPPPYDVPSCFWSVDQVALSLWLRHWTLVVIMQYTIFSLNFIISLGRSFYKLQLSDLLPFLGINIIIVYIYISWNDLPASLKDSSLSKNSFRNSFRKLLKTFFNDF